ncbi:MAG: hypothetical protein ABW019_10360 [Chitinophagaceae bacterium]
MNYNRRVLLFVTWSTGLLLVLSVAGSYAGIGWMPFRRVNLVSDVLIAPADSSAAEEGLPGSDPDPSMAATPGKPRENFSLYTKPASLTDFRADTTRSSLQGFAKKLYELKAGQKRKIRIAYFGDSMIEGDLLTQTLRELLQQLFGGQGVGFVPVTSPVAKFRQTVSTDYSDSWADDNFKEGKNPRLFLSGHSFHTTDGWVQWNDRTITPDSLIIEKSLLCGAAPGPVTVNANGRSVTVPAGNIFNRVVLAKDQSPALRLAVADDRLPVYGVSFESESGVFVDNFSFRGITGVEFARIDSGFLRSIANGNPYDLIVFQYGVNLLFRPNDKNFSWYEKTILPVVRKLRNCFPGSDFVIVSTADRAFRYNGQYQSAVGIDSLVRVQASLAYRTGSVFYNQFATMGGKNSIVDWAGRKPSLANKDYVHPNHRGAEVLAGYFFEAILREYEKYVRTRDR